MVWQRRAKPPGQFLCRFDSCRLRLGSEDRRLRTVPSSIFDSRSSNFTGVAQPGRGAGLRNQLMRVRIPPPVPKLEDRESRIENRESKIGVHPRCSILDPRIGWRSPTGRGDWLKPSLVEVRILPPAPGKNCELRIADCGIRAS
jgi:hypothetical protein